MDLSKTWTIDQNEVQMSFDVVNLYPSILVKEAIYIVTMMLRSDPSLEQRTKLSVDDIRQPTSDGTLLVQMLLSVERKYLFTQEFSFNRRLTLMVVMAESFLQHHEKKRH